jgi:hypothetical protein
VHYNKHQTTTAATGSTAPTAAKSTISEKDFLQVTK